MKLYGEIELGPALQTIQEFINKQMTAPLLVITCNLAAY